MTKIKDKNNKLILKREEKPEYELVVTEFDDLKNYRKNKRKKKKKTDSQQR